ncbi:peptidase S41 [Thermosipho melanesiensis]|uniref:Carboxyl-terminal protease n=2 Tax=Thermosipho melanesiensis TaxID=46541 RepID=A6LJJ7_THEM4|nr:S41 family peptidase [Thermosipho melanesiensis]ABR30098.1 carboxyl-terminal protease [Thermosipho melanesiensis BI429]APT73295.1 peptidase S41 [Thermosipho melanesiensis]OOC38686.1 peptidase S41 [Thermosipho melanesiensis]OOC40490.1 peptidase S41 [Thermosipho melanesiensis]OOC40755.1 peptidase S41 [Thermosipho melanesiensis]
MNKKNYIITSFILFGVFLTSIFLSGATEKTFQEHLTPLAETLYYILNYYYDMDNVDVNKVIDYGIDGLIKGLGDDFSYYYNVELFKEREIENKGEYGGLGIEVTYDPDARAIKIISPMYGTPAWKAGLKAGDLIISIDGTPVKDISYLDAVNMMRGEPGTIVKLTVLRNDEILEFKIKREIIKITPVKYGFVETEMGRIGYVRLTQFNQPSSKKLEEALQKIYDKGVTALIFDLRDNPGGYLDSAIDVASMFLESGKLIVTVEPRVGQVERYVSKGNNFQNVPVVILVNGGSASASEIVTGALKENNRAVIIGERTFGKGSVQQGFPLSNGGMVYITIAHYKTPSGNDIHKVGIEPNIFVTGDATKVEHERVVVDYTKEFTEVDTNDPYIKRALEYLLEGK